MYDNIVSTEFTYADGDDDDLFRARTPTSWFGRLARSDSSSTLAPVSVELKSFIVLFSFFSRVETKF